MSVNEAFFSVSGYVASQPRRRVLRDGTLLVSFRIAWTPRTISRATQEWSDLPSSFASVSCYRRVAENVDTSVRKGDAVLVTGFLRVREYDDEAGVRKYSVEVTAEHIGHDLARRAAGAASQRQPAALTAAEFAGQAGRQLLPGDSGAGRSARPWPLSAVPDDASELAAAAR